MVRVGFDQFATGDRRKIVTRLFPRLCVAFGCCLAFAAATNAATLPTFGTWYDSGLVLMPGPGTFFTDSIIANQNTEVEITGYWDNTDRYEVFVNANLVLTTPAIVPPSAAIDYGDSFGIYTTPASALGSGLFSSGQFYVNSGDVITVEDIGPLFLDSAASANAGFPQYDAQVGLQSTPEPSSFAFLAGGIGIALALLRRRFALITK
jgi:hypothetical protein